MLIQNPFAVRSLVLTILTVTSTTVRGLSFNYTQEYLIGDNGQEMISSQIKGKIILKPSECPVQCIFNFFLCH